MSSDCEMCWNDDMCDPRDYDSNGYSDSESETNEVSVNERSEATGVNLESEEYEYTVTFKIPLKAVSILYRRIDEVIDKLIYDELLKQEDVGITINQL